MTTANFVWSTNINEVKFKQLFCNRIPLAQNYQNDRGKIKTKLHNLNAHICKTILGFNTINSRYQENMED